MGKHHTRNTKTNRYQKKQQAYIEKKRNSQKIDKVPNRVTRDKLAELKDKNSELVSEANKRLELIKMSGYHSYAADKVSRETGLDYFDISAVSNREELIRELTRVRVFLADKGSTIEGAKLETAQVAASQYKGMFGNQFNNEENKFKSYDTKHIDEETFKRACTAYHKISESRQAQIANDGGYGSENLIMALYDAEIRGQDSLVFGMDLLDTFVKTESIQYNKIREQSNLLNGITGDVDNITGGYTF